MIVPKVPKNWLETLVRIFGVFEWLSAFFVSEQSVSKIVLLAHGVFLVKVRFLMLIVYSWCLLLLVLFITQRNVFFFLSLPVWRKILSVRPFSF